MAGAFDRRQIFDMAGISPAIGAFDAVPAGVPDYGFGPMTPQTQNGFESAELRQGPLESPDETFGRYVDYGAFPARAFIDQAGRGGVAASEAYDDPSLANITNAGVQTGLAFGSPAVVAGSALTGFGLGAAKDLGFSNPLSSTANADDISAMVKGDPQLEILYKQYQTEIEASKANVPGRNKAESAAIRAAAGDRAAATMKTIGQALSDKAEAVRSRGRADYDGAVESATARRDAEMAKDRRFSDTEVGKVYDKLGGLAPVAAGMTYGLASRLGAGPAKTWPAALGRGAEGAALGVTAIHAPLAYNAFATEPDNPQQRAYSEYAYGLPEGHPEKAAAQQRADTLPKANPLREAAQSELYDGKKLAERLLFGSIEGAGGYGLGALIPPAIGGLARKSSYQIGPDDVTPPPPSGGFTAMKDAGPPSPKNAGAFGAPKESPASKPMDLRSTETISPPKLPPTKSNIKNGSLLNPKAMALRVNKEVAKLTADDAAAAFAKSNPGMPRAQLNAHKKLLKDAAIKNPFATAEDLHKLIATGIKTEKKKPGVYGAALRGLNDN